MCKSSQVASYQRPKKWCSIPPCLTLRIIRYGTRVKWSNPGKEVASFPTPWCSSYWKGSYCHQLYIYIYIYILPIIKKNVRPANDSWLRVSCRRSSGEMVIHTSDIFSRTKLYFCSIFESCDHQVGGIKSFVMQIGDKLQNKCLLFRLE